MLSCRQGVIEGAFIQNNAFKANMPILNCDLDDPCMLSLGWLQGRWEWPDVSAQCGSFQDVERKQYSNIVVRAQFYVEG